MGRPKGYKQTEVQKAKIGQANKISLRGYRTSDEHRKKLSESKIGKKRKSWTWEKDKKPSSAQKREASAGRKKPEECELCGAYGRICYDHNHSTGKFRGWICWRCNIVLGHVRDSSQLLIMMSDYINKI